MSFSYFIYLYIFICVCLIVFEIGWLIYYGARERLQAGRTARYEEYLRRQCETLASGGELPSLDHRQKLFFRKVFSNSHKIIAFACAFQNVSRDFPDEIGKAVGIVDEEALFIMKHVQGHTKSASRVYSLKLFADMTAYTWRNRPGRLVEYQFAFLTDPSVYCRTYAMDVLYALGTANDLHRAVMLLSDKNLFYHPKVLMEGLMSFRGDHRVLSLLLIRDFDKLSEDYRIAVLEYCRHRAPLIGPFLVEFLTGEYSVDVKCTTLRYFRKYPIPEAKPVIVDFLEHDDKYAWEISAIAAKALSAYPEPDVKELLKRRLSHPNWYIRRNSAESLVSIGLFVAEQAEIMNRSDRFAREILEYNLLVAAKNKMRPGAGLPGGDIL